MSEVGQRFGKLGGLILSLPMSDAGKVASLAGETLVFLLPSLIFFIALLLMLKRQANFYLAFSLSVFATLGAYAVFYKLRGEL